jgi:retinol dehydrogenase-13
MDNRTAIITGSTGAIGRAIVRQVLAGGEYRVVMIARDDAKAELFRRELSRDVDSGRLICEIIDLARKDDIYGLAGRIEWPVHLLVNNAAHSPRARQETPEGIERQWATNVLGYYWMISAFTPHLKAAAPARIVNVASYWAGGLDLDDPEFRRRRYDNDEAYRQSKQADRMLTAALAERLKPFSITVNACHPGDVNSRLSNDLGFGGHETPDQGADTPVWLATSRNVDGITGKYFARRRQETCEFGQDRAGIEQLMKLLKSY